MYTSPTDLLGNLSAYSYRLPTQEDFSGAITAILRLQETYSLEARVIAEGELGREPSLSMSGMCLFLILYHGDIYGNYKTQLVIGKTLVTRDLKITHPVVLLYVYIVAGTHKGKEHLTPIAQCIRTVL